MTSGRAADLADSELRWYAFRELVGIRAMKRKGLITKIARSRRYQLTGLGRRVAVLFTKTYGRVLAPGLSELDARPPEDVTARCEVGTTWRSFERALDDFIQAQLVAP